MVHDGKRGDYQRWRCWACRSGGGNLEADFPKPEQMLIWMEAAMGEALEGESKQVGVLRAEFEKKTTSFMKRYGILTEKQAERVRIWEDGRSEDGVEEDELVGDPGQDAALALIDKLMGEMRAEFNREGQ